LWQPSRFDTTEKLPEEVVMNFHRSARIAALLSALGWATLAGSGLVAAAESVSKETAQQAIENAKIAVKKTDGVGYLWRDTDKLLKEAEEAFSKGDNAVAVKNADSAKFQAEAGYEQYLQQRNAKPPF
jgi:hypothetical protein